MRNGLPRSYDAWRTAAPDVDDELPPGYEFANHEGGEWIDCRWCGDRADISGEFVVMREVKSYLGRLRWHWFCSPECARADHADHMVCAAEMRADARRDR